MEYFKMQMSNVLHKSLLGTSSHKLGNYSIPVWPRRCCLLRGNSHFLNDTLVARGVSAFLRYFLHFQEVIYTLE